MLVRDPSGLTKQKHNSVSKDIKFTDHSEIQIMNSAHYMLKSQEIIKPDSEFTSNQATSLAFLKQSNHGQPLTHHEYRSSVSTEKMHSTSVVIDYIEQIHRDLNP